jgi:hypothetical protein
MQERAPMPSTLSEPAWRALRQLDPEVEQMVSLANCLAMVEQRFQLLFAQVLPRFGEAPPDDLGAEADVLADAHHALTLLQDSLHASSRRMLDVLDRVSRELGE